MADPSPPVALAVPGSHRRDYAIEVLRWVCILAVVAHHGVFPDRYSDATLESIHRFLRILGWCVLAFFSISGALLKPQASFSTLVASRAKRLLVPYLAVSALSFALPWFANWAGYFHRDAATTCDWHLFLRNVVLLNGFGPQLYFLPYLFVVTIFYAALLRFFRPSTLLMVLLMGLCAQGIWTPWPVGSFGPGPDKLLLYIVAFGSGHWFRSRSDGSARYRLPVLVVASVCGIGAACALGKTWPVDLVVPFWLYAALRCWTPGPSSSRILDRFNPGAIFLWHAPLLLPAISIGLNRLGIVQGWNYLGSCVLVVPGSLCVDKAVRKLGLKGIFSF